MRVLLLLILNIGFSQALAFENNSGQAYPEDSASEYNSTSEDPTYGAGLYELEDERPLDEHEQEAPPAQEPMDENDNADIFWTSQGEVKTAPQIEPVQEVAPEVRQHLPTQIIDCPSCTYGRKSKFKEHPWYNLSVAVKMQKVMNNANYINRLHNTKIDPRFMACIAYKESKFHPLAVSSTQARGLFQSLRYNGVYAAMQARRGFKPKLQGFSQLNSYSYYDKMAKSTLAQTEISMLLMLNDKMPSDARFLRVSQGRGTVTTEDYADVGRRYYGYFTKPGTYNYRISMAYKNYIKRCLGCLWKGSVTKEGVIKNERAAVNCLGN